MKLSSEAPEPLSYTGYPLAFHEAVHQLVCEDEEILISAFNQWNERIFGPLARVLPSSTKRCSDGRWSLYQKERYCDCHDNVLVLLLRHGYDLDEMVEDLIGYDMDAHNPRLRNLLNSYLDRN